MGKRKRSKPVDYFAILEAMDTPMEDPFLEALRRKIRQEPTVPPNAIPPDVVAAARELGVALPTSVFIVRMTFNRVVAQRHPDANLGHDRGVQRATEARDVLLRYLR